MILFFDIDATLLTTSGSGMGALHEAGKAQFGPTFTIEGISFAGRLDPLIMADMLRINNLPDTPENHARIRSSYLPLLGERLARPSAANALPGVHQLLAALAPSAAAGHITLGLLTGNFAESGTMKLRACGIDPSQFVIAAWGDDAPHHPEKPARREDLVPIGMGRARQHRSLHPHEFTIIGDTPHDVRCAKAHGGRCLAVATGKFSLEELSRESPDRAVSDLTATEDLRAWLLRES